ncbi:hypothetical protein BO70DRAFT_52759 [Aspergillus heteromorphus CBS 117.55]|uniref:Uncharacterized protein n=1 Tax=Aspergillus heteromorphus CBS 117.55 TaxID=1448321 RepID=A0A317VZI2_9EURO|nr:uncharacterized protein BO70DRAFT_52759 [Aspergillus heteromorphus CBS 117.55]PWY79663.1 hypothetical protein BO70DRAFT_52759 [Aspergillus heteromorphus CBS 117.55]
MAVNAFGGGGSGTRQATSRLFGGFDWGVSPYPGQSAQRVVRLSDSHHHKLSPGLNQASRPQANGIVVVREASSQTWGLSGPPVLVNPKSPSPSVTVTVTVTVTRRALFTKSSRHQSRLPPITTPRPVLVVRIVIVLVVYPPNPPEGASNTQDKG